MAIRMQKGRSRPFFVYWTNPFTGKRESKSCATREDADASLTCDKIQFAAMLAGQSGVDIKVTGDVTALKRLFAYCTDVTSMFNIIEP